MLTRKFVRARWGIAALIVSALAACGGSDSTGPSGSPDTIVLTSAVLHALDSSAIVIKQSNPGDPTLQALVDSTLLTLTAGVEAKRLDVHTGLTQNAMYFVAVHRAFNSSGGKWATWSVVGFDDPTHLTALIEVAGYAPQGSVPPTSASGAIGDGTGVVNALMLRVASAGVVTQWTANTGSATFASGAAGNPCAGFTATAIVSCAFETTNVGFTIGAASGSNGAGALTASIGSVAQVPGIRLTFTP